MSAFRLTPGAIDERALRLELQDASCGGYASFEGWVRNHNEGHQVQRLEYEAFEPLALSEGEKIIGEARVRFGVQRALCVHRTGALALGEIAVWVGVAAPHRDEAFRACRYIIDEIKHRLPIWKKEHYLSGDSGWVNCERCAAQAAGAAPAHQHARHGDRHS
jgi:molybdopterin synthase catalytic subunit